MDGCQLDLHLSLIHIFQRHLDVLAGHTGLGKLGDLAGRRCKMYVAIAAAAALCDGDGLSLIHI